MVFAFIDLGNGVLQTSQASGAAADGARVAISKYVGADIPGSANRTAIEAAVRARVVSSKVSTVAVTCVTASGTTITCASADPDTDRVRVSVSWRFVALSPVGKALGSQTISASATMSIIRQPIDPPIEEDDP
jgi:hypothetical protein